MNDTVLQSGTVSVTWIVVTKLQLLNRSNIAYFINVQRREFERHFREHEIDGLGAARDRGQMKQCLRLLVAHFNLPLPARPLQQHFHCDPLPKHCRVHQRRHTELNAIAANRDFFIYHSGQRAHVCKRKFTAYTVYI